MIKGGEAETDNIKKNLEEEEEIRINEQLFYSIDTNWEFSPAATSIN